MMFDWIFKKKKKNKEEPKPMSNIANTSIEYGFLQDYIRNKIEASVILSNGFRINGIITGEDSKVITIKANEFSNDEKLIYKNVISTIQPFDPASAAKPAKESREQKPADQVLEPDIMDMMKGDITDPANPFYVKK